MVQVAAAMAAVIDALTIYSLLETVWQPTVPTARAVQHMG